MKNPKYIRKFKKHDCVILTHDNYNAIPKGSKGIITIIGMLHQSKPTYLARFGTTEIRVFEHELAAQ
jgi:hypothetical protein